MRTTHFIPAALLIGLFACNGGSDKTESATDTTGQAAKADSMAMSHVDSSKMITPVPDVPAGAKVFFKNLKKGETVKSPFKVEMGVEGMKLDTAGPIVSGSGHHHLFIDAEDSLAKGTVVPKDSTHLHFGKGQSEVKLTLPPGNHKLTLQYADGIHRSYGSQLSATIEIKVK
jgi:hypothetical protein